MMKAFYNGEEINVSDLKFEWEDHFGRPCSGDLIDYRNSEVNDAVSEFEAGEGW